MARESLGTPVLTIKTCSHKSALMYSNSKLRIFMLREKKPA